MRLSEIIKSYREANKLSQRQFAIKCEDVSNGYISMIENECNPTTGKPIVPSLDKLNSIAIAMNMSLSQLIERADDMDVDISDVQKLHKADDVDVLYISRPTGNSSTDELRKQLHDMIDQLDDEDLQTLSNVTIKFARK
mgnify:CR=1 FL=1